jgi:DNA invertase Pin-like site-specific DNA recombinase
MEQNRKITTEHLSRRAALYVRQSSIRQVVENQESTKRQYSLRQKAVSLGWPDDMIDIIDDDLGVSGASTDRGGFKKLIGEVSQENIGIVISLEASRLSRNSQDWSNLLEICRLTRTLILDEDGIYDPGDFNDRMLLGLKGTMSEAELHYLCARMKGGLDNKAKRGELKIRIPVGYIYDDFDQLVKDPDENVQNVINLVFSTYARFQSCQRTLKELRSQNILFPRKALNGYNRHTMHWREITHANILKMLHNPIYAGVYQFGKKKTQKTLTGYKTTIRAKEDMIAYIENHHEGYIPLEQYHQNQQYLDEHCVTNKEQNPERAAAVREGCALLQGVAYCGKCGKRMSVRYSVYPAYGTMVSKPSYWCVEEKIQTGADACQRISGAVIDKAIGELLIEMVTPLAMESVLQVQNELIARDKEIDFIKRKDLERCLKEMETARTRYFNTDPSNTLVAKHLESDWNDKIRIYEDRMNAYHKERNENLETVDDRVSAQIMAIADNFQSLWENPQVQNEERKRMLRLLIENVIVTQFDNHIHLVVNFKAGTSKDFDIQKGKKSYESWRTPPEALDIIKSGLDQHLSNAEISKILNEKGLKSGRNLVFSRSMVSYIIYHHNLKTVRERYLEMGYVPQSEIIEMTGLDRKKLLNLRRNGEIKDFKIVESTNYMYLLSEFSGYLPA